ncbi:hypothetical protein N431DRAFT_445484 [Stipitochalara longipes BDJ]|nr:hypothetical protein N431DRAFT_445484 [Stipitochalara longipes BDJ]
MSGARTRTGVEVEVRRRVTFGCDVQQEVTFEAAASGLPPGSPAALPAALPGRCRERQGSRSTGWTGCSRAARRQWTLWSSPATILAAMGSRWGGAWMLVGWKRPPGDFVQAWHSSVVSSHNRFFCWPEDRGARPAMVQQMGQQWVNSGPTLGPLNTLSGSNSHSEAPVVLITLPNQLLAEWNFLPLWKSLACGACE